MYSWSYYCEVSTNCLVSRHRHRLVHRIASQVLRAFPFGQSGRVARVAGSVRARVPEAREAHQAQSEAEGQGACGRPSQSDGASLVSQSKPGKRDLGPGKPIHNKGLAHARAVGESNRIAGLVAGCCAGGRPGARHSPAQSLPNE